MAILDYATHSILEKYMYMYMYSVDIPYNLTLLCRHYTGITKTPNTQSNASTLYIVLVSTQESRLDICMSPSLAVPELNTLSAGKVNVGNRSSCLQALCLHFLWPLFLIPTMYHHTTHCPYSCGYPQIWSCAYVHVTWDNHQPSLVPRPLPCFQCYTRALKKIGETGDKATPNHTCIVPSLP